MDHIGTNVRRTTNPYATPKTSWTTRWLIAAALVLAAVLLTACDVHGPSAVGELASITVTPNSTVASLSSQQMVAKGYDADGKEVGISPTWSISASGGTISQSGLFSAGTVPGVYANTVHATVGTTSGSASITVTAGPLASITFLPSPVTMAAMSTQQFTAVAVDASGNVVQFTPTWSVLAGGGTINQQGMFTAGGTLGAFTNTVQVSSNGIKAFATVNVTAGPVATIVVSPTPATLAPNGVQVFTAVGRDAANNVTAITPVWSVQQGGAISTGGTFTAGAVQGTFTNTVRATSGTIFGSATVTVNSGALATITVTPNPASMAVSTQQQFVAVGRDASNNVIAITPTWSLAIGGGTIGAATGLFTAGAVVGAFANTVVATSGTITGTATVNVTAVLAPPPAAAANLGLAAPNGIMAGTAVTCITGGIINADVSISPGNTITGFGPCVITGVQNLANAVALAAQGALTTAYNTLAGLPCVAANAIVANLGGTTKPAGVYCTSIGISVSGVLTLDGGGDPNASFVFQAGTSLTTAGNIVLINGAQAKNVWWQVGSSATLGTGSLFQGNILALTSITLVDGATLNGRALARNGAVSLGTNNVITIP